MKCSVRAEHLRVWQHRYDETGNPLYLWKIVGVCLQDPHEPDSLPPGVLKYLRWVSVQLEKVQGWPRAPEVAQLATHALYVVSKERSRNAFASLAQDEKDVALALEAERDRAGALARANKEDRHARRRLARGRRLLGSGRI